MIQESVKASLTEALSLLPSNMDSIQARVQLLATGLQESRLTHRYQIIDGGGKGPARGLLQFERGGGVKGVMTHAATKQHAERIAELRGVPFNAQDIWTRLEFDDVLAFAFGRLLYWADPKSLPPLGNPEAAWDCYISAWRPGKPHRRTWDAFYNAALLSADRRGAAR
jgi:hypothetical protein